MKRRLPLLCIAALTATALGLQWAVLHVFAVGSEVFSSNREEGVSVGAALVQSLKQHQNCSVCEYLNEKRTEEGNRSGHQMVSLEIEGISLPSKTIFSANFIGSQFICGPPSGAPQFIASLRPPPPQPAA